MTPLQLVHYWVSLGTLGAVLLAAVTIIVGICRPRLDKLGDTLVKRGAVASLIIVGFYLVYCATAVTTVLVLRS